MATENTPSADFSAIIKELEKVSKEWLKIAKSQDSTASSLDKTLGKFDTLAKEVGGVSKELKSAVAGMETLIASQRRLATQTTTTTEALRRQKSTLATPVTTPVEKISAIVQKGMTKEDLSKTMANSKEIIAYKDAIGRLKEILGRKNVTELQASKIFGELKAGETVAYTGTLRKVRNAMDDVMVARAKLGAAFRKELDAIAASDAAQAKEKKRIDDTNTALRAQEALRRANAAAMSKGVAATGTLLQQQPLLTKTPADRALGTTDRTMRVVQATMPEMLNYKNAIARVKELQSQHEVTYGRIRQIWTDLGQNKVKAYVGGLGDIQNALYKVRTTHEQLGASFKKQADAEAAAYVQSHVSQQRASSGIARFKEQIGELTVSWKSFSRLLAVQIFHQAVSSLVRTMAEGMQTVVELGVKIGEVRTISQDAQLSNAEWREGFRQLSDAFGTPILDQVAAGYEAISDQIVKGADTFKYLAEVNRFAATTASTTLEAHQLLGSTMNAFGMDLSRVQGIAASFFSTIDLGRVRAREMAESFGQIAVPAHQFGVTLNELQSLITVGTRQGIRYNTTATYLRNMFLKLQKPTEEMSKYFREIGVSSGQAAIATYGFIPFLTMLSEKFDDNSEEIAKLMGNIRAMQGGMITTGANLQSVKSDFEAIKKAVTEYNEASKIMLEQTPEKKIQMLSESLKNFFTVDITATMVEMVASIGLSLDQVKSLVVGTVAALSAAVIGVIGGVALTLLSNPLIAGFTAFMTLLGTFYAEYLTQKNKEVVIDTATAKNKIAWEQKKFDAVNENYDKEKALFDEAVQHQLQTLSGLKSILVYDINALKAPYENFIASTGRLEEKIIEGIRDQISETTSEITRLAGVAKKKQKEFNEEMKVYDLIMARRLTGKDTPSRREPTTERKFEATAASMKMLEEELVRASASANDKRFEAIAGKMESTMKEVVDLSDKYAEEKGLGSRQLIASGESYFRYWFGRVEEQRRVMQNNAAAEIGQYQTKEQFLQDEISRVRDLAKIVKETSWTDIGKIKDPEEFNRVMKEQASASQKLQEYGKKYGIDFYKKVQLALEGARVEELILLKNQEFQVDAQSQIAQKIKKRQDDEYDRNRLIAIEYLKGYLNANKEIREINEIVYGAKATMSLGGKDLKNPTNTTEERDALVQKFMAEQTQNSLYELTKKRQDGEKEGDRVKWQDYETKGKEAVQSVEEIFKQITIHPETSQGSIKKDTQERQLLEKQGNQSTWKDYREDGKESIILLADLESSSKEKLIRQTEELKQKTLDTINGINKSLGEPEIKAPIPKTLEPKTPEPPKNFQEQLNDFFKKKRSGEKDSTWEDYTIKGKEAIATVFKDQALTWERAKEEVKDIQILVSGIALPSDLGKPFEDLSKVHAYMLDDVIPDRFLDKIQNVIEDQERAVVRMPIVLEESKRAAENWNRETQEGIKASIEAFKMLQTMEPPSSKVAPQKTGISKITTEDIDKVRIEQDSRKEALTSITYRQSLETQKNKETWNSYTVDGKEAIDSVEEAFKLIKIIDPKQAITSQEQIATTIEKRQQAEYARNVLNINDYELGMVRASQAIYNLGPQKSVELFPELRQSFTVIEQVQSQIEGETQTRIELERQGFIDNWTLYRQLGTSAIQATTPSRSIINNLPAAVPGPTLESYGRAFRYSGGRSAGIDTQPAWLSPQEMVMNPSASRRFYSTLVALNAGQRRFSSGSSGPTYNVGDVNINGISSSASQNVINMGRALRKQIKLGRLNLGT